MKSYIIIVNPFSGKKKGLNILNNIESILDDKGYLFDTHITEDSGDAFALAQTLNISNYDGIIMIGGDGTFHEIVNGMMNRKDNARIPVGIIPGGTGNSFLLDLNITDPIQALDRIFLNKTKKIDILRTKYKQNIKYSINLVGWGMITDVGLTSEKFRLFGYSRYTIAAVIEIFFKKTRYATLKIDNNIIEGEFMFAIACNSKNVGKGMLMAPNAKLDDGLIDVIIAEGNISRLRLLNVLPKLFNGTHINEPEVKYIQCKEFNLISEGNDQLNIDGEMIGESPFESKVLEKEIDIFY